MKISKREFEDISKAWLIISFAFSLILTNTTITNLARIFSLDYIYFLVIILFSAGLGFLLHELAHKYVAMKYGCKAEFRADQQMLYLALGMAAIIGFLFAAPGAVMIIGNVTRKTNGIISLAGPLTNYVLAMIFLLISPYTKIFGQLGFQVNMWLGLFNMIPFGNFDGIKIFNYSPAIWISMVIFGVYTLFF